METGRTAAALSGRMPVHYVSGIICRQYRQLPHGTAYLGLHVVSASLQGTNLPRVFRAVVRPVRAGGFSVCVSASGGQFDAKKSRIPFAIAAAMES